MAMFCFAPPIGFFPLAPHNSCNLIIIVILSLYSVYPAVCPISSLVSYIVRRMSIDCNAIACLPSLHTTSLRWYEAERCVEMIIIDFSEKPENEWYTGTFVSDKAGATHNGV
jgi:hypothetical protein